MDDSIVTARVPRETKNQVANILKQQGSSPSEAINALYEYILEAKKLPDELLAKKRLYTAADIDKALSLLDSMSIASDSRFNDMSADEILRERAVARGLTN